MAMKKLIELTDKEINVGSMTGILTRLEGWIKDRKEVWHKGLSKRVKLSPENCRIFEKKVYHGGYGLMVGDRDMGCLTNFSDNVDEAEWRYKMDICYKKWFEPPMWKDIDEGYLFRFLAGDDFYELVVYKRSKNKGDVFLKNLCNGKSIIAEINETKENYEKACKIVHDMIENYKGEYDD